MPTQVRVTIEGTKVCEVRVTGKDVLDTPVELIPGQAVAKNLHNMMGPQVLEVRELRDYVPQ